ncbi:hypothetical protein ANN_07990 [Periplaneta americana]|uniref:Piwi domain-containing protein n=1 Tax=Periplaneta americana TaxID=6978 RepID=A0ABQ8T1R8_PERAM|nr:hypothetical protein ANN_07990 [Periplaneta americana]
MSCEPARRAQTLCRPAIMVAEELKSWNMEMSKSLVSLSGRILPSEYVILGSNTKCESGGASDWTNSLRSHPMLLSKAVNTWLVVVPEHLLRDTIVFVTTLRTTAYKMGLQLPDPSYRQLCDDRLTSYMDGLQGGIISTNPELILVVLPNNRSDRYSAVKKKCCVDHPVPTQVILHKNISGSKMKPVAVKLAIQMNCKLGGAPWTVEIPLQFETPFLNNKMRQKYDVCDFVLLKPVHFQNDHLPPQYTSNNDVQQSDMPTGLLLMEYHTVPSKKYGEIISLEDRPHHTVTPGRLMDLTPPDFYLWEALKQACQNPAHCAVAHIVHLSLCDVHFLFPYLEEVNRLGGERDMAKVMVVGFDVYHDSLHQGMSIGALVASLDKAMIRYFSAVSYHRTGEELSNELSANICKALQKFKEYNNGCLPQRIIIYRDGVGEGQIQYVKEHEVDTLEKNLSKVYGGEPVKMAFIVVTKRINTRLFYNGTNPPPGTVVDDVITLPSRYDFFLVSQSVLQGTVSPTSYNVIYDNVGLDADKLQRLTYKLTHMYFNWSGTVRVPAPCQYAHKLAYLVGQALHQAPSQSRLQNVLYFL